MLNGKADNLTALARRFLEPSNATHRQYEALRAYFVEGLSSAEAARRFGYTPGSFRVLVHKFRQEPDRPFFEPPRKGRQRASSKDRVRERIVALRKQNLSIYEIAETLACEDTKLSAVRCWQILNEEGFARLPRRRDEERPPRARPERAAVADVRQLDLSPRRFRTKFGGLFLFVPYLAQLPFDEMMRQARLPGSRMIPAAQAMRSLLALKLWGNPRWSHVMSDVFDEGLALFAGLNTIAKRAFLTEYSCRISPAAYPPLMRLWFDAVGRLGLERGTSFDLDFHPIPFHGEDALMEKHYVTKRSRRQKGVLAFLAQDAKTRVFCYGNAQVRKADQNNEVLRFVEFWRQRTGGVPEELIFDSKLTTYANLHKLNTMGIRFVTLRRRSRTMLEAIARQPRSAWRRIELEGVSRQYKTPRVLDERIALRDYEGPLRQITVADLGHEEPTILLTNHLRRAPATLVERYAKRMLIENNIADGVDFFHMDALSSAVAMKVNCDVQLSLMASSLYHLLATQIGNGYQNAKSRHLFRDFVDATAQVTVAPDALVVCFQKRAHNPLLLAAGFDTVDAAIPWLGNKRLQLIFG
jgi:transposase